MQSVFKMVNMKSVVILEENAKSKQEMQQIQYNRTVSNPNDNDIGDYAIDALQREGTDRAVDFIFDSLFCVK